MVAGSPVPGAVLTAALVIGKEWRKKKDMVYGAGETARQAKVLSTKADDMSLLPGMHTVEGET